MLEAFNNERDPFQARLAQHYSFPDQPQLISNKTTRSRGVASTGLTGYSHTRQSTTASSAVPGMSHGTTLSGTYVATSHASIAEQHYGWDEVGGINVPRTLPTVTQYECPFNFLGCTSVFINDEPRWMAHTDSHFHGCPLPQHAVCCFCDRIFDNPNPRICWNTKMNHVAQHHRSGDSLARAKPDHSLMRYMYEQEIMSKQDYDRTLPYHEVPPGYGPGQLGPNSSGGSAFNRGGQGGSGSSSGNYLIVEDPRRRGHRGGRSGRG